MIKVLATTVALLLLPISTAWSEPLICKQIGYYDTKTKDLVEIDKNASYLTVIPEEDGTVTMTRIDGTSEAELEIRFKFVKAIKNYTNSPGDHLMLFTSTSHKERIFSRMIGPEMVDGKPTSVIDMASESFIKQTKAYEERYFCILVTKKPTTKI